MRALKQIFELDSFRNYPPAALILNEYGLIGDCCSDGESLFGYHREELLLKHVSVLLPQLADLHLIQDGALNPRLDFLCHCGHRFVAQTRDGSCFHSQLHFVHLQHRDRTMIRLIVRPAAEEPSAIRMPALIEATAIL